MVQPFSVEASKLVLLEEALQMLIKKALDYENFARPLDLIINIYPSSLVWQIQKYLKHVPLGEMLQHLQ